jgi:hypothetical protein
MNKQAFQGAVLGNVAIGGGDARARMNKHSEGIIPGNDAVDVKGGEVGDDSCDKVWTARSGG